MLTIPTIAVSESKNKVGLDPVEIERELYDLENKVKIIDTNQLNYKIEKDLLKETYSNNYEQINLIITIVLGIIALLGFLGLRDISSIKKNFNSELKILESKLNNLKNINLSKDL